MIFVGLHPWNELVNSAHLQAEKRQYCDGPNGVPAPSEAVTAGQRSRRLESLTESGCFHSDVNHIHFVVGRSN